MKRWTMRDDHMNALSATLTQQAMRGLHALALLRTLDAEAGREFGRRLLAALEGT